MKYTCIDMSHHKVTQCTPSPGAVPRYLLVLLEDDSPLTQVAYTNFFSMLLPGSKVLLSRSPQQTLDLCTSQTFDFLIIDQKLPALSTTTIELLSSLSARTSVVIISAVSQRELHIPTALARICVLRKPIRTESLLAKLKPRFDTRN
jgi:DNA-binding NarL/FixJ family response regulator